MRSAAFGGVTLAIVIFGSLISGLALDVLVTGQADPLNWLETQAGVMVLLAIISVHLRMPVPFVGAGTTGSLCTIGLLCGLATRSWPWTGMAVLSAISFSFLLGSIALLRWVGAGPWRWGGMCLLFVGIPLAGLLRAGEWPLSQGRPTVAVVTALPLFSDPGDLSTHPSRASAISALERSFRMVPVDSPAMAGLSSYRHLLLAQPRLLAPSELMALDTWVRSGGRAVILADPLLVWPSDLPPGDRRRAPLTSLLDPLLAHWGLRLGPVEPGREGVERRFLANGALLPIAAASRFTATTSLCGVVEDGLVALCRVGSGQVRLIADADLLDSRLWLSGPNHPMSRRARNGDTIALLANWLLAPLDADIVSPSRPLWVRDDASLLAGVRWALLAGAAWVVLGTGAIWPRGKRGRHGNNRNCTTKV